MTLHQEGLDAGNFRDDGDSIHATIYTPSGRFLDVNTLGLRRSLSRWKNRSGSCKGSETDVENEALFSLKSGSHPRRPSARRDAEADLLQPARSCGRHLAGCDPKCQVGPGQHARYRDGSLPALRPRGWALADRNYWSSDLFDRLEVRGLVLLAPFKSRKNDSEKRWSGRLTRMRRRVETARGQLTGRFNAKKVWAMDRWHPWSRWTRKVASHTMAVLLCRREGLPPLRFAELVER